MKRTERGEHIALVEKCRRLAYRYPALATLYHIPNGGKKEHRQTRYGYTLSDEGMLLQRMGVVAGMPDLCLPVASDGYGALYIELKCGKGKLSPVQEEVHDRLRKAGNHVVTCWTVESAWDMICVHLGIEEED